MFLSYIIGALLGIVGVCMIPTRPSISSQQGETIQETSARIDLEYKDSLLKSDAFKICLAAVATISLGILLHIYSCCTESEEECEDIKIYPEIIQVSRIPKIYLHPVRAPTPPKMLTHVQKIESDPTPPKKILSEIGVNPLEAKPYNSFAHYPPKWRPQG